jgi:hypothetical protein
MTAFRFTLDLCHKGFIDISGINQIPLIKKGIDCPSGAGSRDAIDRSGSEVQRVQGGLHPAYI